jgi:hypothetical protein
MLCEGHKLMRCRSQRNQRESPLLRLPAELRNAIYVWAFSGQPMFVRAITYYGVSTRSLAMGTYHSISILLACRQMHVEAESLLYKYSCFNVCFIFESVSRFALKRTPVQLDAITSLKPSILWYYQPRLSQCELAADVSGAFRFLHKLSGLRHLHIEIEFLNTNVNKEQRWGISR